MDVNAIGNNINSNKIYNSGSDSSQYSNVVNKNIEVSNTKKIENSQENKENQGNRDKQGNQEGFSKKDLDKAVGKLNKFLEDEKTHAEYSIHKELGTTMIKIIDDDTKKVILEIPSEKILNMVASMCEQVGLIDKKA